MPFQESRRVKSEQAQWFDQVADSYNRSHKAYPDALVDDIIVFAGLHHGGKVLEIGCGTGQATASFAARGLNVLGLEPGAHMAALARQNLARYPNVQISCESFERWELEPEAFDIIIAAHAFHWVDRKIRFIKAAHALKPGGVLANFRSVALPGSTTVDFALRRVVSVPAKPGATKRRWPSEKQFSRSPYFRLPEKRLYPSADVYDTESFANRLQCALALQRLSVAERERVLKSVRQIVTENGGTISVSYETQLIMARRKANISWLSRLLRRKQ